MAVSPIPTILSLFSRSHHHHHHPPDSFVESTAYTLLGPHPVALIIASFILDTVGQAALILLLATVLFSTRVRQRNITLVNLLIVTVLCSFPPALLCVPLPIAYAPP